MAPTLSIGSLLLRIEEGDFKNLWLGALPLWTKGAKASGSPKGTVMTLTFRLQSTVLYGCISNLCHNAYSALQGTARKREMCEKLSRGGDKERCGWVKDKYALSLQIVPFVLGEMLQSGMLRDRNES